METSPLWRHRYLQINICVEKSRIEKGAGKDLGCNLRVSLGSQSVWLVHLALCILDAQKMAPCDFWIPEVKVTSFSCNFVFLSGLLEMTERGFTVYKLSVHGIITITCGRTCSSVPKVPDTMRNGILQNEIPSFASTP